MSRNDGGFCFKYHNVKGKMVSLDLHKQCIAIQQIMSDEEQSVIDASGSEILCQLNLLDDFLGEGILLRESGFFPIQRIVLSGFKQKTEAGIQQQDHIVEEAFTLADQFLERTVVDQILLHQVICLMIVMENG